MGKLMHSTQIQHSSHPHLLQLSSSHHLHNHPSATCAGCNHHISPADHIYACTPCNFIIHTSCSKFPELITHPSHPTHPLSLLPTPIYPGGFFRCDACTQHGTRFSYHCHTCDFDLHVLCASNPLRVTHPSHPHPLGLTFASPYGEKLGFSCDVCCRIGSGDQWLYRCVSCEFDVHLHCATAKAPSPPPALQHHHSFPGSGGPPMGGQVLTHSMSAGPQVQSQISHSQWQPTQSPVPGGGVQSYNQPPAPVGGQIYQSPAQPPAPIGGQNYQMSPQPDQSNNGMGNVMVTGFVDGMMQQLGQDFVQSLTGGGGGGGGGGDVVNIDYQTNVTYEDNVTYENNGN